MRILLRKATRSDPTTFIVGFGSWAIICGICLLLPGNMFDYTPAWSSLQAIRADDTAWGVAMLLDGIALVTSIRLRKVPQRASIAGFSAVMWILLGGSMVFSAYSAGITSIIGFYSIWGGFCCLLAVEQWVYYPNGGIK